MTEDKITTIRVKESTKSLIGEEGGKGDTYEDIIINLIKDIRDYRRRCG